MGIRTQQIRPLERGDLEQVASLFELVARSGSRTPAPGLVRHFARTFLDHPWADEAIPSLVYLGDDGAIVGFLGSHVRRLRFDGRSVRAACAGQLVTDPAARSKAAGAFLIQTLFSGPQELTFTDTASPIVTRIWARLGGNTHHLGCVGWLRVFRPWSLLGDYLATRDERGANRLGRPVATGLDALTVRLLASRLRAPHSGTRTVPLTAAGLVANLPAVVGSLRLYPDYDAPFLEWLFQELESVRSRGTLVRSLVVDGNEGPLGWYVYYLRPGGASHVLQIAAKPRSVGRVIDQLFHDADSRGAAALHGRLEPPLYEALSERRCVLRFSGYGALVHSTEPEILRSIFAGDALLTRLEGEWWMGHDAEPLDA